jgi:hypothetical protein
VGVALWILTAAPRRKRRLHSRMSFVFAGWNLAINPAICLAGEADGLAGIVLGALNPLA